MDREALKSKLEKYKIPLLVLLVGLVLVLFPGGEKKAASAEEPSARLQTLLCKTEGVGKAQVLISESGVVVVCDGAENPKVKLDIIRAVGSYTGFGADKITVLKMSDMSREENDS